MDSFPVCSTEVNKIIFLFKFLFQAAKVEFLGWPSHLLSYGFLKMFRQKELITELPTWIF